MRRSGERRGAGLLALTAGAGVVALVVWAFGSGLGTREPAAFAVPGTGAEAAADPALRAAGSAALPGITALVDPSCAAERAARTGIPPRALLAYAGAELATAADAPACGIRWTTLAALGSVESGHGTHDGSVIAPDGATTPGIFGARLDGVDTAHIADTDGGALDGLADIDRAVGPLQFIPGTWAIWGADGDGNGAADPQQIDDAALAAARYLCSAGDLRDPAAWRAAIFAYNNLDSYVAAVADTATRYAELAGP